MEESILAGLRQLPDTTSVQILEPSGPFQNIQELLGSRKKMTLIGKKGCAVFFRKDSKIILIQSRANANLGAIDRLLGSIE